MSVDHTGIDEHVIYKTLVLTGNVTGPLVGVIPVDTHLNEKKLAKVSGNKKVNMVPLKNLLKTTGYVHGANTPVGIYEKFQYPIFIDNEAKEQGEIYAEDLAGLVHATFADLEQK